MRSGSNTLFHSLLSPALNIGLLTPGEVCSAAVRAYEKGRAPIHSVEGFVRQIAGWREYIRGIYWMKMPGYASTNFLDGKRCLPDFYWTGEPRMNCLREAIKSTRMNAYAHHIQRLVITGNFALIAGIDPAQVEKWYLTVYADAYEWVELPNTHGMALYADGGLLASKPYAVSGSYINRMSDYCAGCVYDHRQNNGPNACPFNYLYWDFIIRNESRLRSNPRMAMSYRNLDRMPDERRKQISIDSALFLQTLESPE
jgi:deoxyribodipyrimidine photolyase-related protein